MMYSDPDLAGWSGQRSEKTPCLPLAAVQASSSPVAFPRMRVRRTSPRGGSEDGRMRQLRAARTRYRSGAKALASVRVSRDLAGFGFREFASSLALSSSRGEEILGAEKETPLDAARSREKRLPLFSVAWMDLAEMRSRDSREIEKSSEGHR